MKQRLGAALVIGCILYQLLCVCSLLEVYFLRTRMIPTEALNAQVWKVSDPEADRIVFILVDGLRADSLFALRSNAAASDQIDNTGHNNDNVTPPPNTTPRGDPLPPAVQGAVGGGVGRRASAEREEKDVVAPFLREMIRSGDARWGIAKASLPTESVPGHFRLLAGVESDPYVLLNRDQNYTFSPESMFTVTNGAYSFWCNRPYSAVTSVYQQLAKSKRGVFANVVHRHSDDQVAKTCDDTVFLAAEEFLTRSSHDKDFENMGWKKFFYLDLQSIDSVERSNSVEYLEAVTKVDNHTDYFYRLFETLFKDRRTTYILASDHGRHHEGWHGMNRPEIIYTPFVVWGAGIAPNQNFDWKTSKENRNSLYWLKDNYFLEDKAAVHTWAAHIYEPTFIDQIDLVPFMATLLGVDTPYQSMGKLANILQLLSTTPRGYVESLYSNAQQLWSQYRALLSMNFWAVPLTYIGIIASPPSPSSLFATECAASPAKPQQQASPDGPAGKGCPELTHKALQDAKYYSIWLAQTAVDAINTFYTYVSLIPTMAVIVLSNACLTYYLMGEAIFPNDQRPFVSKQTPEFPWYAKGVLVGTIIAVVWLGLFVLGAAFHIYLHWAVIIGLIPFILKKWKHWNNWWYLAYAVVTSYLPEGWSQRENYSVSFVQLALRADPPLMAHHYSILFLGIYLLIKGYYNHLWIPMVWLAVSCWGLRGEPIGKRPRTVVNASFLLRNIKFIWVLVTGLMALFSMVPVRYLPNYESIWMSGMLFAAVVMAVDILLAQNLSWNTATYTLVKVASILSILWIDYETMEFMTNYTFQTLSWFILGISVAVAIVSAGKKKTWFEMANNLLYCILCASLLLSISFESAYMLIHIAIQLAWVGMEFCLYQMPHNVPEKGRSQVLCRILFGFWLLTQTALLGTRSVNSLCFNHSGYPVREGNPYPAFYRFWGGVGQWRLPPQFHLLLLYWVQLLSPLIFVAFTTATIVNIWRETLSPVVRLPVLMASFSICCGLQAFLGIQVHGVAWLETGETVTVWILESIMFMLFLMLYELGKIIAPPLSSGGALPKTNPDSAIQQI